jgi:hypothetical protein
VADKTLISQGQWLGIDVGSRRDKVFNFCLIKSDGKGQIELCFEVGEGGDAFPRSNARCFADLSRETTWLSWAAEKGSVDILKESALVKDWNAARNFGNGCFGVCIDAPCGFAVRGCDRRNTENQLVASFLTPHFDVFLDRMRNFIQEENNTPLRQSYFWKLVGLVAFRYFVALTTGQPFDMRIEELTKSCMVSGKVRIREGFPSDTYKRSNVPVLHGDMTHVSRPAALR